MAKTSSKGKLKALTGHSQCPGFLVIIGAICASILSFFTLRPELYWICTLILIFSITALITNNRFLNSMVVAAFLLYAMLIPLTIMFPQPIALVIHFTNFTLICVVLYRNWKNTSPIVIMLTGVFYAIYIQAYIIGVKPEFGSEDQFHQYYNIWIGLIIVVSSALMAFLIKQKTNKWF